MNTVGQLIRDANPIQGEPSLLADDELNALLLLAQTRSGNVDVQELSKPVEPDKKQRSGWLIAAASFAVVVALLGAVTLLTNRADELPPATTPPTTVTPTTVAADSAPEPIPTPSEAVAVANAWHDALNAGDVDAMMALFAPDPALSTSITGTYTLEEERLVSTWDAAQGTRLETDGCVSVGESPERYQHVRCIGANHDALVQAVDATPVPVVVDMTIGPDGIVALRSSIGSPDFKHASDPFNEWMAANQPHAYKDISFGSWETVEEAKVAGNLRAHYAAKWATYLEANDCTYLDGC
jgi:hypothetical protein